MSEALNLAPRRVAWANIGSIRNAGFRSVRDLHSGFTSGTNRVDLGGFDRPDIPRRTFPQLTVKRAQPATMVADLLGEQDVVLGLPAKGKRSTLARVATWLGDRAGMDQGAVLAAMLRRERLGSTAIGHRVAIPHARLEGLSAPKVMLATLQHPVWFDAPDEGPVDLLLALLWPKSDSVGFLQALAYFCRLLRHPELRDRIRAAETSAEALAWLESFEERTSEPPSGNPFSISYTRFPCLPWEGRGMNGFF
jgi:PTS system nitrogen regulatory IIA component